MDWLSLGILIMKLVLCVAVGCIIGDFAKRDILSKAKNTYGGFKEKGIERQTDTIEKKYAYDLIDTELMGLGIKYRMGSNFTPFDYLLFRLLIALIAGLVSMLLSSFLILPVFIFVYVIIGVLFKQADKEDNAGMMEDIRQMYGIVSLQLKNKVFITEVMYDCYMSTSHPRLKKALLELSMDLGQFHDVKMATELFKKKFNNEYINIFAKTLEQAEETGMALDLLQDMEKQMMGIDDALAIKEEDRIDDVSNAFTFFIFLGAIAVCAYVMFQFIGSGEMSFF